MTVGQVAAGTLGCGRVFKVPVKVHWSLFVAAPVWFFLFMREWRMVSVPFPPAAGASRTRRAVALVVVL